MLLNTLVDYFLETNSAQAMHILSSVREPHDKVRNGPAQEPGFKSAKFCSEIVVFSTSPPPCRRQNYFVRIFRRLQLWWILACGFMLRTNNNTSWQSWPLRGQRATEFKVASSSCVALCPHLTSCFRIKPVSEERNGNRQLWDRTTWYIYFFWINCGFAVPVANTSYIIYLCQCPYTNRISPSSLHLVFLPSGYKTRI